MSNSFAIPWTVTHQAPLSVGFPREEYYSGVAIFHSRGSSWPRHQTQVSCIGRQILYYWTTRGTHVSPKKDLKLHGHSSQVWVRWHMPHPSLLESLEQRQKFLPFRRNWDGLKGKTLGQWQRNGTAKVTAAKMFEKLKGFHPVPRQFS